MKSVESSQDTRRLNRKAIKSAYAYHSLYESISLLVLINFTMRLHRRFHSTFSFWFFFSEVFEENPLLLLLCVNADSVHTLGSDYFHHGFFPAQRSQILLFNVFISNHAGFSFDLNQWRNKLMEMMELVRIKLIPILCWYYSYKHTE